MNTFVSRLFGKDYAHLLNLTPKGRRELRNFDCRANYLRESTMDALKNTPSHIFEDIRRLLNLLGHLLVDGQVVDTFQQFIALGSIADFNIHTQIDVVAVSHDLFEVVAPVRSAKLHLLKLNNRPHIRTDIFAI